MNNMRKAFEEWATAAPREWDISRFDEESPRLPGQYFCHVIQTAWEAWQAACEAEREWMLDLTYSYADSLSWNDDFQAAIRARSQQ